MESIKHRTRNPRVCRLVTFQFFITYNFQYFVRKTPENSKLVIVTGKLYSPIRDYYNSSLLKVKKKKTTVCEASCVWLKTRKLKELATLNFLTDLWKEVNYLNLATKPVDKAILSHTSLINFTNLFRSIRYSTEITVRLSSSVPFELSPSTEGRQLKSLRKQSEVA